MTAERPALRFAADLHCHILPGIDDGALDVEDALAMARQAEGAGIEAVCATPHIRHDHDVRIAELPGRIASLEAALAGAGCGTRILAGGEVAVTALERLRPDELLATTLGGAGRWILLEPAPGPLDDRLQRAVEALGERGLRALIAHPERHLSEELIPRLTRLIAAGALVQATAAFFCQPAIRPGMRTLAEAGLVHVLGSDAHSSHGGRRIELAPAFEVLRTVERCAPHLEWMALTAPRAIVRGEDVEPPF